MSTKLTSSQRFWSKVKITDDCWIYGGGVATNGYGHFSVTPTAGTYKTVLAHRYSYEKLIGTIPDGMQLDHLCHTVECADECMHRSCVRPSHLSPTTPRDNTLRSKSLSAINAAKTHCPRGHTFDDTSSIITNSRPERRCLICKRESNRLWMRSHYERKAHA